MDIIHRNDVQVNAVIKLTPCRQGVSVCLYINSLNCVFYMPQLNNAVIFHKTNQQRKDEALDINLELITTVWSIKERQ